MSDAVGYVVTVYNKAKFLAGCLDAILAQEGGPPAEIVFVDDGSTDGSGDLLRDLIAARGAAQARVISQRTPGPVPPPIAACARRPRPGSKSSMPTIRSRPSPRAFCARKRCATIWV